DGHESVDVVDAQRGRGLSPADADAEVSGAEGAQRVLVGDVVAREQHGGRSDPLAQVRDGGVLPLVAERELEDVVSRATPPPGRLGGDQLVGDLPDGAGGLGIRGPGVHAEAVLLRFDPDAGRPGGATTDLVLQLIPEGEVRVVVRRRLDTHPRYPELHAVGAREPDERVVRVLRDLAEVSERASGDESDDRAGKRDQVAEHGTGPRRHARRHRLIDERGEGAVEVDGDQQAVGRGDGLDRGVGGGHSASSLSEPPSTSAAAAALEAVSWNVARASRNSRDQSSTS
ncbi:hypothetical protein COLO4_01811, partial [Corchorus olitorius]